MATTKNPAVLWNIDQNLSAAEKERARSNIGTGNKVTEWSGTPSDNNYPSEKLVSDALAESGKAYVATYGVTTKNELDAALAAGKALFLNFSEDTDIVDSDPGDESDEGTLRGTVTAGTIFVPATDIREGGSGIYSFIGRVRYAVYPAYMNPFHMHNTMMDVIAYLDYDYDTSEYVWKIELETSVKTTLNINQAEHPQFSDIHINDETLDTSDSIGVNINGYNGILPVLPDSGAGSAYLRDDGTWSEIDTSANNHFTQISGVKKLGTLSIAENDADKVYAGAMFSVICRQNNGNNFQGFLCIRKFEWSTTSYGNTANVSKFIVINDSNKYTTSVPDLTFYTFVPENTHNIEIWCSANVRVGLTLLNTAMTWDPVVNHVVGTLPSGSETIKNIRMTVDDENKMPFIGMRENTDNYTNGISYGDYYGNNTAICGWKVMTTIANHQWESNSFNGILMVEDWTSNPEGETTGRFIGTIEIYERMSSATASESNVVYGARLVQINSAVSRMAWRIYAKKTSVTDGAQIDWYIGKPNSNDTGIGQSVKYSKITILPIGQVSSSSQMYRKMERLAEPMAMTQSYLPLVNTVNANGCNNNAGSSVGNGIYLDNGRIHEQKLKSVILDVPCTNGNTTGKAIRLAMGSTTTNYSSLRFRTSTGQHLCDLTVTLNSDFSTAYARGFVSETFVNIEPNIYIDSTNKYLYIWWPTLTTGTSGIQTGNVKRVYLDYAYDTAANPTISVVDIPSSLSNLTYVHIVSYMSGTVLCSHPSSLGDACHRDQMFRIIRHDNGIDGTGNTTGSIKISELIRGQAYVCLVPGAVGSFVVRNDTGGYIDYWMDGTYYTVSNNDSCQLTCSDAARGCNCIFIITRTTNKDLWIFRGY